MTLSHFWIVKEHLPNSCTDDPFESPPSPCRISRIPWLQINFSQRKVIINRHSAYHWNAKIMRNCSICTALINYYFLLWKVETNSGICIQEVYCRWKTGGNNKNRYYLLGVLVSSESRKKVHQLTVNRPQVLISCVSRGAKSEELIGLDQFIWVLFKSFKYFWTGAPDIFERYVRWKAIWESSCMIIQLSFNTNNIASERVSIVLPIQYSHNNDCHLSACE